MTRPSPRPTSWLVAALLVFAPAAALAQDDGSRDPAADIDDRARVEELIQSLNSPSVRNVPYVLRERINRLISSGHPAATRHLRALLGDTGAHQGTVAHVIREALVDRAALHLLDDVVERLRMERDSKLGRLFDTELLRYADLALVGRLTELAQDPERSDGYRSTAVDMLGRTGHAAALPGLLALWGDESADVRRAASRAFVSIVPGVTSRDEAAELVREMREQDLPFAELLRRRLRQAERERPVPTVPVQNYESDYRELARALLPLASFDDLLALYLTSPLPDLRAAGAERLRTFAFDDHADPAGARVFAAKALLRALRDETLDDVESALLAALLPLSPAVVENVEQGDLQALRDRARVDGRASREVRVATIDVLTALADPRTVGFLQEQFALLGDTDPDLRIELLDALAASNGDLTGWLCERVLDERHVRVMRHMVLKLGKDPDPAAIPVFTELLSRRKGDGAPRYDDEARSFVVSALARLWTRRDDTRARDVLIEHGLTDPAGAIRETAAGGLSTPRPGDREPCLRALADVVAHAEEEPRVREVAARGVLDLAPTGALGWLGDAIDEKLIWDVYRSRRTEELRGGHIDVDDVLVEAQVLNGAGRSDQAIDLLKAVVEAGSGLWEGRDGRGQVRETLVEGLLAAGRPADACVFAEALVADPPRTGDPTHRWRLLLARSLRACGQGDRLQRAVAELRTLRGDADLPAHLRARVGVELGHALLQLDEPTPARAVLAAVEMPSADLDDEQTERLAGLLERAETESDAEQTRVLELVARGAEPGAQEALSAFGHRAARHVAEALDGVNDPGTARPLLAAAALLTSETFVLGEQPTAEQVVEVVASARAALARLVAAADSTGSR